MHHHQRLRSIQTLFEDDELLVVLKPAGVAGSRILKLVRRELPTCAEVLQPQRVATNLVDVVFVAKTNAAKNALLRMRRREKSLTMRNLAIVHGLISEVFVENFHEPNASLKILKTVRTNSACGFLTLLEFQRTGALAQLKRTMMNECKFPVVGRGSHTKKLSAGHSSSTTRNWLATFGATFSWGNQFINVSSSDVLNDFLAFLEGQENAWKGCTLKRKQQILNQMNLPEAKQVACKEIDEFAATRMPISKLTGIATFFGSTFLVSSGVFEPNLSSEALVATTLQLFAEEEEDPKKVLDLGTGSGNLLLSILMHRKTWTGVGVDLNGEAIEMSKRNAERFDVDHRCEFLAGDFQVISAGRAFDLIVCNPPYLPTKSLNDSLKMKHEDRTATNGGVDGLDGYRSVANLLRREVIQQRSRDTTLVIEVAGGFEAKRNKVVELLESSGMQLLRKGHRDKFGMERCLVFRSILYKK